MTDERSPGGVPHQQGELDVTDLLDVAGGFDTDGDGRADTVVTDDGVDLVLLTDLDGDGLADQILRIGPDGIVRETPLPDTASARDGALPDGLTDADPGI